MIPLEYDIDRLKGICFEMIDLVRNQLALTRESIITGDHDPACEVMRKETRVNAYELTLDRECEDFIALHAPVAADLRLVIALIKMSGSLERIGDHAYRISSFIFEDKLSFSKELIQLIDLPGLFDEIDEMLANVTEAFEKGDIKTAKLVFKQDKKLNKIHKKLPELMQDYLKHHKDSVSNVILVSSTVGKLERTGDLITNMAEEIIFYIESKIIKHKKRDKKIRKRFSLFGPQEA
jgi:phosphate transport system protein